VSVDVLLNLSENVLTFDELSKDSLVTIQILSGVEGNHELVTVVGGAVGGGGQETSLVVAEAEITIGVPGTESAVVFLVSAASDDTETSHTLVDGGTNIGAESLSEVAGSDGLLLFEKFENEVADLLTGGGNGEEDSGVSGAAVVVEGGESTLGKCVHFINY
jgi:hypothetical protein